MKLFVLSKENLELSQAEAERLHGIKGRRAGEFLFLDVDECQEGLALTRSIHDILFETSTEKLESDAAGFDWNRHVEPPFAVRGIDEKKFAGHVWRALEAAGKQPSVDLKNPKTKIVVFKIKEKIMITKSLWVNQEKFFDRRPHLRPKNHPTGLSPKLARAMVNLAGAETILDPFCGAGGILLEGSLAGRRMTGVDIDERQIARAEENLTHYEVAATLTIGDATRCDALGAFDAIVTDLPLGKNAKLENPESTFSGFFKAAARITGTVVVATDSQFNLRKCFRKFFEEKGYFDWYLHKGMEKRIFLLGKP